MYRQQTSEPEWYRSSLTFQRGPDSATPLARPNRIARMSREELEGRVRTLERQRRELRKQVTHLNQLHIQDLHNVSSMREVLNELGWEASYAPDGE